MSPTKRSVLTCVLVLAAILSLSVLIFFHYTNFGKPYVAESYGTKVKLAIWFFRWPNLFHVTYEVDDINRWEAAEVHTLFGKKTEICCRDEQVRAIVEGGKLIFLWDPERTSSKGDDIRSEAGKLMMDSVKKLLDIEGFFENVPKPEEQGTPSNPA